MELERQLQSRDNRHSVNKKKMSELEEQLQSQQERCRAIQLDSSELQNKLRIRDKEVQDTLSKHTNLEVCF